jgi:hypothetical protein
MNFNYFVLIILWVILPMVLWKSVPRNRLREAIATFLLFQMLTWLFSIGLTYVGLLESPIRFLKYATKVNFTMEYIVFPTVAVLFQLKFPNKANFVRGLLHYLQWIGIILTFMLLIGFFTDIMVVKMDNLIRSFFNFLIELWLCRRYVLWLIKQPELAKVFST